MPPNPTVPNTKADNLDVFGISHDRDPHTDHNRGHRCLHVHSDAENAASEPAEPDVKLELPSSYLLVREGFAETPPPNNEDGV